MPAHAISKIDAFRHLAAHNAEQKGSCGKFSSLPISIRRSSSAIGCFTILPVREDFSHLGFGKIYGGGKTIDVHAEAQLKFMSLPEHILDIHRGAGFPEDVLA